MVSVRTSKLWSRRIKKYWGMYEDSEGALMYSDPCYYFELVLHEYVHLWLLSMPLFRDRTINTSHAIKEEIAELETWRADLQEIRTTAIVIRLFDEFGLLREDREEDILDAGRGGMQLTWTIADHEYAIRRSMNSKFVARITKEMKPVIARICNMERE
jgi:hypothetical protein